MTPPADTSTEEVLGKYLTTLESLLRLLTPNHPFQPILAASIDLSTWQAIFAHECELLFNACKGANLPPEAFQAYEELHGFAAELFAAPHFARYLADEHPDRDAGEFLPEPDFYHENRHLLEVSKQARAVRQGLEQKLQAAEALWHEANERLLTVLTAEPDLAGRSLFAAIETSHEDELAPSHLPDVLQSLLLPPDEHNHTQRATVKEQSERDEKLWRVRGCLLSTVLPRLADAVRDFLPNRSKKGDTDAQKSNRSKRQAITVKLQAAISDWLTRFDIVSGWHRLLASHESVVAIESLLRACRGGFRTSPESLAANRIQFFEGLQAIPVEVLDQKRLKSWNEQLEQAGVVDLVAESLFLTLKGASAVGPTSLEGRLQKTGLCADPATNEKRISRGLQKLANSGLATHGSENWEPWLSTPNSEREKQGSGRRTLRPVQGWLINPLAIKIKQVNDAVRRLAPEYMP